ncbi:sigma-70 family RNA polymerase sigma factor [Mycolicibacter arupensis]|jgi:RNA polymerase sigma-70 factor (ECF subfamily)|uniref:Sigma-70 family RNA polymerase sigma factor n=1 Tax=Mycolicibacter arupensis TaxID=342002 RepID=A0A5C7XPS0_9MYCO|nr:sigma-70 family RNA polymerase sigma factor [Mycolicibacter arupensis]TXI51499.1 MAG: sigma-70 family RNA polymerase sigma factor [Mycolicibacter arupensis]
MNQALRKTNNRADAEDLLQDTLIHAYTGFRTFEPGSNLKAWMFRIMANQCINTFRKKERRPSEYLADDISDYLLASSAAHISTGLRSTETEVLEALPDGDIRAAVQKLPVAFATTLYYSDVEGYSYREIAEMTGVPIGTVMSRLARGRKQLRTSLIDVADKRGLYRKQRKGK